MTNKTIVLGMVQRGGKIVAGPIPNASSDTLESIIDANVERGSTISTDEWGGYTDLRRRYMHDTVNHSAKEYTRGIHHVNTLESHWSLFKRAVKGTHVHISTKHAWKYVSEFSYRRNMRHSHSAMFNLLVHAFALPRVIEN
jgi:transposase-like protein